MAAASNPDSPFAFLADYPAESIARSLADETETVAGLVLSQAPPALMAKVLANMNAQRQREVVCGIRKARGIQPARLSRLAMTIHNKLKQLPAHSSSPKNSAHAPGLQAWQPRRDSSAKPVNIPASDTDTGRQKAMQKALALVRDKAAAAADPHQAPTPDGNARRINGLAVAAEILRMAPPEVRRNISSNEPRLYQALRNRMFVFDDLVKSPDAALAEIFTAVDPHTAALALRFAQPKLTTRALMAVSSRRGALVRDEMELAISSSTRVRVRDIEDAQQQVLEVALKLQRAGKIIIDPAEPDIIEEG